MDLIRPRIAEAAGGPLSLGTGDDILFGGRTPSMSEQTRVPAAVRTEEGLTIDEARARLFLHACSLCASWERLRCRTTPEDLVQAVLGRMSTTAGEGGADELPRLSYMIRSLQNEARDEAKRKLPEPNEALSDGSWSPEDGRIDGHPEKRMLAREEQGRAATTQRSVTRRFLAVLARMEPAFNGAAQVDYYAVLLFAMRQQLASGLLAGGWITPPLLTVKLAEFLPWSEPWSSRSFKRGWPSVGALWTECAPGWDGPPHRVVASTIIECLDRLHGAPTRLSQATWDQWRARALERLRVHADPAVRVELFELLFPQLRRDEESV